MPTAAYKTTGAGSVFDWGTRDRLKRFVRFCDENLMVPHGHGAGLPFGWTKTQRAWVESIIHCELSVVMVARANAKTTTMAAVALWWLFDPPEGDHRPEVTVVASSKLQAGGLYGSCIAMVEAGPLAERCKVYHDANQPHILAENGGKLGVRAANPRQLQGLNPSLVILDEVGAATSGVYTSLVQALGKRPQARMVAIGTPVWEEGILHELKAQADAGKLPEYVAFHDHSAPATADIDDRKAWKAANPIKSELDPKGWQRSLEMQRATVPAAEFEIFNLCRFADLRGDPIVEPEQWDLLEGLTFHPDDADTIDELGFAVAIVGSWDRKSLAVVAAVPDDEITNVLPLGVWQDQDQQVPISDILEAVHSLGVEPWQVTVTRSAQAEEVVEALKLEGLQVEETSLSSVSNTRRPTDLFLAAVNGGQLRHDGSPPLRAQVINARTEVRKDGLYFTRDERSPERIDALLASVVAVQTATDLPRVMVY